MKRLFGMAAKMQVRTNVKEPTENEFTKIVLCVVRSGGIRGGKNGGRPDYVRLRHAPLPGHCVILRHAHAHAALGPPHSHARAPRSDFDP